MRVGGFWPRSRSETCSGCTKLWADVAGEQHGAFGIRAGTTGALNGALSTVQRQHLRLEFLVREGLGQARLVPECFGQGPVAAGRSIR